MFLRNVSDLTMPEQCGVLWYYTTCPLGVSSDTISPSSLSIPLCMHVPSHFHSPLPCATVFGLMCDLTPEQVCVGMVKALWWQSDEPSVTCVCLSVWNGTWQTHCLETVGNRAICHLLHNPLSLTPLGRSGNVMREDIRHAVTQIHVHGQLMLSIITISGGKKTQRRQDENFF